MRTYRATLVLGGLTLIGLGGSIFAPGGWQAAAAGLAMIAGIGAAYGFAALGGLLPAAVARRPVTAPLPLPAR
jgi:hypothetical protein